MSAPTPGLADPSSSYRAIEKLIMTYAELVDDGNFAGLGTLIAAATFTGGGAPVSGADAIQQMFRNTVIVYADGTPRTRHITTNVIIEVDEEPGTAISRSYFTALQALPDLPLQPIASGRYRDRFQGRDGQWRFLERQVSVDLTGDVRHPPAPTLNRPGRAPSLRVRGRLAQERWAAARRSSSGRASRAGAALAAASSSSGPAQASPRTAALQRHRQACRPHGPGDGRAVGPRPRPDR